MPCFESSVSTESVEGGLRPMGRGSHGLLIASFTALSITSSACKKIKDILNKFRGIYDLFVHYQSNHWINGKGEICAQDLCGQPQRYSEPSDKHESFIILWSSRASYRISYYQARKLGLKGDNVVECNKFSALRISRRFSYMINPQFHFHMNYVEINTKKITRWNDGRAEYYRVKVKRTLWHAILCSNSIVKSVRVLHFPITCSQWTYLTL